MYLIAHWVAHTLVALQNFEKNAILFFGDKNKETDLYKVVFGRNWESAMPGFFYR